MPQQTVQLTATLKDASGNTLSGRSTTWQSSAGGVATVSSDGLVSAVTAGSAVVTATSEGKNASATITVKEGAVVGSAGGTVTAAGGNATVTIPASAIGGSVAISVTPNASPPANPKLVAGTGFDFGPDGTTFSQPVTIKLRYDAANVGAGNPASFRLHRYSGSAWTLLPGSTVDVATRTVTGQTSSFSLYAVVEVAPVVTVSVSPPASQVLAGGTLQLTATPKDGTGAALGGRTVTWQSSDNTKATVSTTGLVTAVAAGSATVTATSEGIDGVATVEVITPTNVPTFSKPFAGEYPTGNFLDHDIPKEFVDANNTFTTFWGEVHPGRGAMIDGHSGYDFTIPIGVPILAVADGRVELAQTTSVSFFCPPLNRNVDDQASVRIEHTLPGGTKVLSWYVHLSRVDVTVNQQVTAGQQIGLNGNSGCSGGPHLHFEVYRRTPTKLITLDPYGWGGAGADPWEQHVDGTPSIQLWKAGQAPQLWRETVNNFAQGAPSAAAVIAKVVYQGVRDDQNPNNEYVEIALDSRVAAQVSLNGYRLKGDKSGLNFLFPNGITLNAGRPSIRIYSGSGTATASEIYLGRSAGTWSNLLADDCARLVSPGGGQYRWNLGNGCPLPGPAPETLSPLINPERAPFDFHGASRQVLLQRP